MKYRVTIERVTSTKTPYKAEWLKLYDSVEDAIKGRVGGNADAPEDFETQQDRNSRLMYGYVTPPGEHEESTEEEIYTQEVDQLDIVAVINAVNGA